MTEVIHSFQNCLGAGARAEPAALLHRRSAAPRARGEAGEGRRSRLQRRKWRADARERLICNWGRADWCSWWRRAGAAAGGGHFQTPRAAARARGRLRRGGGGVIPAPGPELLSPPPALLFLSPREEREREGAAPRRAGPCAWRAGGWPGCPRFAAPPRVSSRFPHPTRSSPAQIQALHPFYPRSFSLPSPTFPPTLQPLELPSVGLPPHLRPPNPESRASPSDLLFPGPGYSPHPIPSLCDRLCGPRLSGLRIPAPGSSFTPGLPLLGARGRPHSPR